MDFPGIARASGLLSVSWTFATSATPRKLAPEWANGATIAVGDARTLGGWILVATAITSGTTGASLATPVAAADGLVDNGVTWSVRSGSLRSLSALNRDTGTNIIRVGDSVIQNASVLPSQGYGPLQLDPGATYAYAVTGTPVLEIVGQS